MAGLHIRLFGFPQYERDGETLEIPRRKGSALVAYLAVTGRAHSRDVLAALLWPELDQSGARGNLRRELSRIKGVFPEELSIETDRVGWNPIHEFWLDVTEFQNMMDASKKTGLALQERISLLAAAARLYTDDFLAGFSLPDSQAFDEWQFFEAESLRGKLADALQQLLGLHTENGEYDLAIEYARRWVALDPLHEPAQRKLIELYALSGQHSAALRQYRAAFRLLKEKLGIEPDEETRALYDAVRTRQMADAKEAVSARPLSPAPSVQPEEQELTSRTHYNNLPIQSTPFIGREEELKKLDELLMNPEVRLITIVGLGGVGKTRLAIAAAQRTVQDRSEFSDGAVLVSLVGVKAIEDIPAAIAKALQISLAGHVDPLTEVGNYLQDKQILILLDNFEHLLDGASLLNQLLETVPKIKLLVTSREPLRLTSEWRLDIEGLRYPKEQPSILAEPSAQVFDIAQAYEAVQLFVRNAQQVNPEFQLTKENISHVYRLCQMVSGVPLAIHLAATWLRVMPADQVVAELSRNMDILTSQLRDLPPRQRSIRAIFNSTWGMLSPEEQHAFKALSVFHASFTDKAAAQVANITPYLSAGLIDRGLVRFSEEGRYEIHELTRKFAEEKQFTKGMGAAIEERHRAYYLDLLTQNEAALHGEDPAVALSLLLQEIDNIRQAWKSAVLHSDLPLIEHSTESLAALYEFSGLLREGERVFQNAVLKLAEGGQEGRVQRVVCHLKTKRIYFSICRGSMKDVEQDLAGVEDLAEQLQDDLRLAVLFNLHGLVFMLIGRHEAAEEYLRRSITLFEDLGIYRELAAAYNYLGELLSRELRTEEALACHEKALEIGNRLGNARIRALSLSHMGVNEYYRDRFRKALDHWEGAIALFEKLQERRGLGRTLNNSGFVLIYLGDYERALKSNQRALLMLHQIGDHLSEANTNDTLAETYFAMGLFQEAERCLQRSIEFTQHSGLLLLEDTLFRINMAKVDIELGRYEKAGEVLNQILNLLEGSGNQKYLAKTLYTLGTLHYRIGAMEQALKYYDQAVQALRHAGEVSETAPCLVEKGNILQELGEIEEAAQHVAEGLRIAEEFGRRPVVFRARIVAAKIDHLAEHSQEAAGSLRSLLGSATCEAERAEVHYQLWKILQEPEQARFALAHYRSLLEKTDGIRYRSRLEELESSLNPPHTILPGS